MDTTTLIAEAKARFSHNAAKAYLKEKYEMRLTIAEQGGLWRADLATINFLNSFDSDELILTDTFQNPIKVNRKTLLDKLKNLYQLVMEEWYTEWSELEKKR